MPRHYSGRVPSISKAYGWYTGKPFSEDELKAVVTFGKPATHSLCVGICGEQYADRVYELNRLCRTDDWKEPLSAFVAAALRRLRTENWIVVSYSDTAMNHHGYIYQACNFLYTGKTKERTDMFVAGGGIVDTQKQQTKESTGLLEVRSIDMFSFAHLTSAKNERGKRH